MGPYWQHVTPSLSATQAPYPQFTILLEARDSVTILQPKYVTTWVMGGTQMAYYTRPFYRTAPFYTGVPVERHRSTQGCL